MLYEEAKMKRCLYCNRLVGCDVRRGLCRTCYKDDEIRIGFDPSSRGAWRSTARHWNIDQDALIINLFEAGMSDKQIAIAMDRSRGSIEKRRQRLGLKVSPKRQATHRKKNHGNSS